MPSVKFSKENFLGKTPIDPKWYLLEVGEFEDKLSKDKDSTNFWGKFKVVNDGPFQGTPIDHCFSEKALGFQGGAADYMACFTADNEKLVDMEVIDALKATSGRQIQGYLEWSPEFRKNQVKDWRAAK